MRVVQYVLQVVNLNLFERALQVHERTQHYTNELVYTSCVNVDSAFRRGKVHQKVLNAGDLRELNVVLSSEIEIAVGANVVEDPP